MNKVVVLVVISLFISLEAFALGLGWSNGISVVAPAGPVALQGVLGFKNISPVDNDLDKSTTIDLTGYVLYPFFKKGSAKLSGFSGMSIKSVTDIDMGYGIKFGISPSVMITDNFALSAKMGVVYTKEHTAINSTADLNDYGTMGGIAVHWMF